NPLDPDSDDDGVLDGADICHGTILGMLVDMRGCMFGDIEADGDVDLADYAVFGSYWLRIDCETSNNWCGWSDFNQSTEVNLLDLANLVAYWLEGIEM
ncbi:hypothetical protein ACFL02_06315, partial [Planctomycetota bacterium]